MNKFQDIECPACKKKFTEGDDIVVCPECGAPYHRECVKDIGKCVFADKHAEGFKFELPEREKQEEPERKGAVCPSCGQENSPDAIYCSRCGGSISGRLEQPGAGRANPFGGYPGQGAGFGAGFGASEAFDPEEEIDGVKAKDIAKYVGDNSGYFISRFRDLKNGTKRITRFNLSALVFEHWYYIYRKMWGPAILIFITSLLLSLPSMLIQFSSYNVVTLNVDSNLLLLLNSVFYILSIALRAVVSFLANKIYMHRVLSNIKKIKESSITPQEYEERLSKRGSVSRPAVIICFAVYFLITMITVGMLTLNGSV